MLVELGLVEQRYKAVLEVLDGGATGTDVARRYGVGRQTVHRWLRRYAAEGLPGLADRSPRPNNCPHQMPPVIEARVVEMRRQHPGWGPRTILSRLARAQVSPLPSRSGIYGALVRHQLIEPKRRRRRASDYKRWERARAMELWQMDITYGVRLRDGSRLAIVTGIDDHSRYCVCAQVVERSTARPVCDALLGAMQRDGVPEAILTDNGKVFTGRFGPRPGEVVSALAAVDPETADKSHDATLRKGMRLTAQVPSIVMAHHAIREGHDPIEPNNDLSHAANFLYMLDGEVPSEDSARLMDKDFILDAEHGSNASSFTARVVTGTQADLHSSITAAIAALSGPSHGGAAENVMKMAQEIEEPERAAAYVKELRSRSEPIMGFGHRVYRAEDPRARHLREGVQRLSAEKGEPKWYAILGAVQEAMRPYGRLGVNVNVDFFAGVIYYLHGIPQDLFVPIFAVGRVPGWTVQVLEQMENNILLHPLLHYVGPLDQPYIPIEER